MFAIYHLMEVRRIREIWSVNIFICDQNGTNRIKKNMRYILTLVIEVGYKESAVIYQCMCIHLQWWFHSRHTAHIADIHCVFPGLLWAKSIYHIEYNYVFRSKIIYLQNFHFVFFSLPANSYVRPESSNRLWSDSTSTSCPAESQK